MTLVSLFFFEFNGGKTFAKEWETANVTNALQMPYERCKCFRMPYQRYQWLANAYEYWRRMTAFAEI